MTTTPDVNPRPRRRRRLLLLGLAAALAVSAVTALAALLLTRDTGDPVAAASNPVDSASPTADAGPVGLSEYERCEANEWDDPRDYLEWVGQYADATAVDAMQDAFFDYQREPEDFGAELELSSAILEVEVSCRESAP